MFSEIHDNVWDWYGSEPKCESAKTMQKLEDRNLEIYDSVRGSMYSKANSSKLSEIRKNDETIDKLMAKEMGYAYSPEVGDALRKVWKWD